jgi:hypothetical protein
MRSWPTSVSGGSEAEEGGLKSEMEWRRGTEDKKAGAGINLL